MFFKYLGTGYKSRLFSQVLIQICENYKNKIVFEINGGCIFENIIRCYYLLGEPVEKYFLQKERTIFF